MVKTDMEESEVLSKFFASVTHGIVSLNQGDVDLMDELFNG